MRPASSNQISAIRNKKHFQVRDRLMRVFGIGFAPKRFLTPFKFRSSQRLRNSPINGLRHTRRPTRSGSLAWRRLYGEKTVRKAERARFLSGGEESEALIKVAFDTLGQKLSVFEPYCLSLSFKVASSIPKYPYIMTDCFLITEKELLTLGTLKL